MAAGSPELPPVARRERFPLAARALRTSTSLPGDLPERSRQRDDSQIRPQTRAPDNWALYLFLFLLPLQNIQTDHLPNFGYGLNFLNVMFALSLIGAWFTRGRIVAGEPVNRWLFVYAAYALISLAVGTQFVDSTQGHFIALKDQLLAVFVVYLVQMSVNDWIALRRVLLVTLLPLPYIAKVMWNQHDGVSGLNYDDDLRIQGTFPLLGANEMAAFCVTAAVVLFALLVAARLSRSWRIALVAGIACMVMGVLYTYSRTAYISLILGVVTVVLVWRGRWKLMLPLLLAAALLPSVLPNSVVERFESSTVEETQRDESTELRFVYWQVAWRNFLAHPVAGTGYHTFHHREISPYGADTHNLYLRALTEGGVLGAVALLGLLLAVLRTARGELAAAASGSLRYGLALGLVGAWMALVLGNLSGDRFTYYPMIAYFWAYVALMLKARHLGPEDTAR